MNGAGRLDGGRRPEVWTADRVFLHFVRTRGKVVEIHDAGNAPPTDVERFLNADVERARKRKSIAGVGIRANELGALVQLRDRDEPRKRLSVLVSGNDTKRNLFRKPVRRGPLDRKCPVAEDAASGECRRVRIRSQLSNDVLVVFKRTV